MSLVLRNIAGAVEQTGDMATMGQPGKYGFCFAESDGGLLPPLAERRGFAPRRKRSHCVRRLRHDGSAAIG